MGAPPAATVLVVEGEAGQRAATATQLRAAGFAVRTAADGLAALYALDRERPDLVVLDLVLPRVSGFRVLHLLKRVGPGAGAPPVLVLTALSFDEAWDAVRDGADDIATKPLAPADLVARCARLLHQHGQHGAATLAGHASLGAAALDARPAPHGVKRPGRGLVAFAPGRRGPQGAPSCSRPVRTSQRAKARRRALSRCARAVPPPSAAEAPRRTRARRSARRLELRVGQPGQQQPRQGRGGGRPGLPGRRVLGRRGRGRGGGGTHRGQCGGWGPGRHEGTS